MAEGTQPMQVSAPSEEVRFGCARLYVSAQAQRYGLTVECFEAVLIEVATKYVSGASDTEVLAFLEGLRLEELALARGCVLGNETAWEVFVTRYRQPMYSAAYTIAKDESVGRELADSLYGDLFGVPREGGERASKLRYYMGRGSLEGWLRTVLAQEFVNRYRRTKHELSLEEKVEAGVQFSAHESSQPVIDSRVDQAITAALAELEAEERFILSAYYLEGRILAEIARVLRVHESTISRKLERLVTALRKDIKKRLVTAGMSARQAEEAMRDVDVRDVNANVRAGLQQETQSDAFYKSTRQKGTPQ